MNVLHRFLAFGLSALFISAGHSQAATSQKDSWEIFSAHGYQGYRDVSTRDIKLPAQYYLARPFAADGWARVLHRDRWHFIDRAGTVMLETDYAQCCFSVTDFDAKGYALVESGQEKWFINREGTRAIAASFVAAAPFQTVPLADEKSIDLAIVAIQNPRAPNDGRDRLYGAINRQGAFHIPAQYARFGEFDAQGIASVTPTQLNPYAPQFMQQFITAAGKPVGGLSRRCGQQVLVNAAGKEHLPKTIERDCAGWVPVGDKTLQTN